MHRQFVRLHIVMWAEGRRALRKRDQTTDNREALYPLGGDATEGYKASNQGVKSTGLEM